MQGYAAGPAAIVHELGHEGGLDHGGPFDARMGDIGSFAVNRPTVMNYAFSYVAGASFSICRSGLTYACHVLRRPASSAHAHSAQ